VASLGGVGFSGSGHVSGSLAAPVIAASGEADIAAGARALDMVFGGNAGNPLREAVLGSLPAQLSVTLDPPRPDGAQSLLLEGIAGTAEMSASLDMTGGLLGVGRENLAVTVEAAADSGEALLT